jgi:hypothetical protein
MLELCKKLQFLSIIFVFLICFSSFVYASDYGYQNPNLPTLQPEEETGTTIIEGANYSINTNRSDFWDDLDTPDDINWLSYLLKFFNQWLNTTDDVSFNTVNATSSLNLNGSTIYDWSDVNASSSGDLTNYTLINETIPIVMDNSTIVRNNQFNITQFIVDAIISINSTWLNSLVQGDSLGNHTAEQNLNMSNYNITYVDRYCLDANCDTSVYEEDGDAVHTISAGDFVFTGGKLNVSDNEAMIDNVNGVLMVGITVT